jgi:YegS/Rv2252/BmrU family lipid kinase
MSVSSRTGPAAARLIFNPAAKGGKARIFQRRLDAFSPFCELRATHAPGDAMRLAAEAVTEGCDTVIAAGGDGTLHEALNGIASVPGGLERARLGVLPLGTINVFAREIGLPLNWVDALDALRAGAEKRIDLPFVDFGSNGTSQRRFFIQLGGAGLDARAVELVDWKLKTRLGPLAYVVAGLKAWREKAGLIHVTRAAEAPAAVSGEWALLGNGRFYGGTLRFFPKADPADGLLDVCVFPRLCVTELARVCLGMAAGRPHAFSRAAHLQGREFFLTSRERVAVELDGEFAGTLPARFSILPKALRVIVPSAAV